VVRSREVVEKQHMQRVQCAEGLEAADEERAGEEACVLHGSFDGDVTTTNHLQHCCVCFCNWKFFPDSRLGTGDTSKVQLLNLNNNFPTIYDSIKNITLPDKKN